MKCARHAELRGRHVRAIMAGQLPCRGPAVAACSANASEASKTLHASAGAQLQQPDQLLLSNTLPRPAARGLFTLHLHSVSLASRFCAPARADGSVDSPTVSAI